MFLMLEKNGWEWWFILMSWLICQSVGTCTFKYITLFLKDLFVGDWLALALSGKKAS